MSAIGVLVGCADDAFRKRLCAALGADRRIQVISETDSPRRLRVLAAARAPTQILIDVEWVREHPDLLNDLPEDAPGARLVVFARRLSSPGVLAAVELGAHACVSRDEDDATWRKVVRAVDAGEAWIPRWLLIEAVTDLQKLLPAGLSAAMHLDRLTERQLEIVTWVAQGLSNKEIGRRLGISPTTVKTHLHNIFERVGVSGRQRLLVTNFGSRSVA